MPSIRLEAGVQSAAGPWVTRALPGRPCASTARWISTGSVPLACGGWPETKAADRLLDHPGVAWRETLEVQTARTVERMRGQPVVLCIQDTTELDFTTQPGIAGLGRLSHEAQPGLYAHPTLR